MQEVMIKTHLIIKDIHEEYFIKWSGSIAGSNPLMKNNKPVFIIRSSGGHVEMNTTDMTLLERVAKKMTDPRGREAFTQDIACIYLKEKDGNEKFLGQLTHNHIKKYAPMYDAVGYE